MGYVVDISDLVESALKWSFLLDDVIGKIPFDDFQHDDLCNLSPRYQDGKSPEVVQKLVAAGCDRGCRYHWRREILLG